MDTCCFWALQDRNKKTEATRQQAGQIARLFEVYCVLLLLVGVVAAAGQCWCLQEKLWLAPYTLYYKAVMKVRHNKPVWQCAAAAIKDLAAL
jgi:hypothetical protein